MNDRQFESVVAAADELRRRRSVRDAHSNADDDLASAIELLAGTGVLTAPVPVEKGGLGTTPSEFARLAAILGEGCLSTAYVWVMHYQQLDAILRHGSAPQVERAVTLASDGGLLASVTTEVATTPSRFGGLTEVGAALESSGGLYEIRRHGPAVSAAGVAAAYLVTIRSSPDAPSHDVSFAFVERERADLEIADVIDLVGMRDTATRPLRLTAKIADSDLIGGRGAFAAILADSIGPIGHLGWASAWSGAAAQALAETRRHVRSTLGRVATADRPQRLIDLAEAMLLSDACRMRCQGLAASIESHRTRGLAPSTRLQVESNLAKVGVSRDAFAAVDLALDLVGMGGYRTSSPIQHVWRDLRAARLTTRNGPLLAAAGQLALLDDDSFRHGWTNPGSLTCAP